MELRFMDCCAVREVTGLARYRNAKTALKHICEIKFMFANCAFMIFTSTNETSYGDNLMKLILKEKLGKVKKTNSKTNPNTRNTVTVFVWEIAQTALRTWYNNNK